MSRGIIEPLSHSFQEVVKTVVKTKPKKMTKAEKGASLKKGQPDSPTGSREA